MARRTATAGETELRGRAAKTARHTLRLLRQGRRLLETGFLEVRVPDDEVGDYWRLDGLPVADATRLLGAEQQALDQAASVLPGRRCCVWRGWLERVRRRMLT